MKTLLSCLLPTLITGLVLSTQAETPLSLSCKVLAGTWSGTYHDTTGLFSPQTQTVQLVLVQHGTHLLGYTITPPAQATASTQPLQSPYANATLYATCAQGALHLLALVPEHSHCANQIANPQAQFTPAGRLTFSTHWESPMIDTVFRFELKRDTIQPPLNAHRLAYAQSLASEPRPHCH